MTAVTFSVPEIVCDTCASSIKKALGGLDGVGAVDVDIAGKKVRVAFDETRTSQAAVRAGIEAAGFEVD